MQYTQVLRRDKDIKDNGILIFFCCDANFQKTSNNKHCKSFHLFRDPIYILSGSCIYTCTLMQVWMSRGAL